MTKTFNPPERILMGPGPSDVNPRILGALGRPTIGHLDPAFVELMDEVKGLLRYAFKTENELTIPISAPGSAGMEACFANLVEPEDKVIVCSNGVFGGRMQENAKRAGGEVILLEHEWGKPVNPERLEQALKENPDVSLVAMVHAETSTGVRSDAKTLCEIAKRFGCLTVLDCVTSLAGVEVSIDDWRVDAAYSGSQKCLSCVPGLSPITFSDEAVRKFQNRKTPVNSWFLDMNLVTEYWAGSEKRSYHHTAPVNSVYALHEALLILKEEGLERSWKRHLDNHILMRDSLENLGFRFLVDEVHRLPQLNAVIPPSSLDEAKIRNSLLNDYNLEVGAGLGALAGKIWRIGLMGYASNRRNVLTCVNAIKDKLHSC